jgi:hypothetical protein
VWKKNCFAWEYKAPGRDLGAALKQLMTYALALDNPPLLVVSDRRRIEIHTHFTGTPSEVNSIALEDIGQPQTTGQHGIHAGERSGMGAWSVQVHGAEVLLEMSRREPAPLQGE